jgi:hypothetical protein
VSELDSWVRKYAVNFNDSASEDVSSHMYVCTTQCTLFC